MFYFEIISKWLSQFCTFFKFFLNVQSIILHDQPHTPKKYFHFSFLFSSWPLLSRQHLILNVQTREFSRTKAIVPDFGSAKPKMANLNCTNAPQVCSSIIWFHGKNRFKSNILYFFLFIGYLFNDEKHRCVEEGEVSCAKTPDLLRISSEPAPIQLRVSQLESFFAQWSRF